MEKKVNDSLYQISSLVDLFCQHCYRYAAVGDYRGANLARQSALNEYRYVLTKTTDSATRAFIKSSVENCGRCKRKGRKQRALCLQYSCGLVVGDIKID